MSQTTAAPVRALFLDEDPIRKSVAEQNARTGFVPDPTATAEKAPAMTRALGIPPERRAR